jgi:transposase
VPLIPPEDRSTALAMRGEHREHLVRERTRLVNQVHRHRCHLEPAYKARLGDLTHPTAWQVCQASPLPPADPVAQVRVRVVQQGAPLLLQLHETIAQVEADQITPLVEEAQPPLVSIQGSGPLTAATVMARVGPIAAVRSAAALACSRGIAPVRVASGAADRHRVNGGGDRQLQTIFSSIALVPKSAVIPWRRPLWPRGGRTARPRKKPSGA